MSDFEQRIRTLMEREAAELVPSELLPKRTRRRVRVRQVLSASIAAMSFVLLAGGIGVAGSEVFNQDAQPPIFPAEQPACSATGLSAEAVPLEGLPEAVDRTRRAIIAAAANCDYEALARIAPDELLYSLIYEPPTRTAAPPDEYWRELEEEGTINGKEAGEYIRRPMALLVGLLNTRAILVEYPEFPGEKDEGGIQEIYEWPAVMGPDPTEEDWEALEGLLGETKVARLRPDIEMGVPYLEYRVSIRAHGAWNTFIAGD